MTVLAARELTVTRGGRRLLDDVSLSLGPGSLTAIVGPNGAGKTTLLRCLAGLIEPDAGAVQLDKKPLAGLSGRDRTRSLGYVPQRFEPAWDYTVRDVLRMGAERVGHAARSLDTIIAGNELGGLLDRRWSGLSGGERARSLFASITVAEPPVLLADEPGASLDIRHRLELLRTLRSYAAGRSVAVVLHELDLALRYCDRVIVMTEGRIALDAPAEEAATSRVFDAVFGIAFVRVPFDSRLGVPLPVELPSAASRSIDGQT